MLQIEKFQRANLDLILTSKSDLLDELADVLPLVALQLNHLTILWMLDHRTIASKLLPTTKTYHETKHYHQ